MQKSERGFSLIEVLVSAFVLAFGVIAAIGMQLTALRTTQQSTFQSYALHLAADMADRMRANVAPMQAADVDNPYLQVDFQSGHVTSNAEVDCYDTDVDCGPAEIAQFDIAEWLARLDHALPNARVRICRDAMRPSAEETLSWNCNASAAFAPVVIKIGWRDKEQAEDDNSDSAPHLALMVASFPT
jgi:type IV pilus assembly protein PilV